MFKKIYLITAIIFLTLIVTSCKTTEETHLEGEVISITEVCKTLESHINLYEAYKQSAELGNKLYRALLFYEECAVFNVPVLAKQIEKVFAGNVSKDYGIEIWKIIFNEDVDVDNNLKYFYIAKAVELTTENDSSA